MSKPSRKFEIWIIFAIFLITLFFSPISLRAAGLHTMSDKMTRQAPSTPASHEITFTTPSGAGGVGDYIRISFDGGFDLSAILFSDVTLTHGPATGIEINETVSAGANATDWGLSVSGNHIDFTHPTNSATGDITANDIVIIKIGGVHQITNPAVIGSKIISLGIYNTLNAEIDSGRLAVAIAQDQVGVNGIPPNTLPTPVILNFPYNVTQTSLDLDWSQNADLFFDRYELYMGNTPGVTNLNGTLLLAVNDRTQTIFNLASLVSGRAYYFVVYVYNLAGNNAPSNEVSATTQSGGGHVWPPPPGQPTINSRVCPIFSSQTNINGAKPLDTIIFINGSADGVTYPDVLSWDKLVNLALGANLFLIYAQDTYGQNSNVLMSTVNRCKAGDTNCNGVVDDFDLAGLAGHWNTNWCYADFNGDGIIDDFDLSGLAARWDSVY